MSASLVANRWLNQHSHSSTSSSATARSTRFVACRSTSSRARCSASSAPTAPARRRRSGCSAGCCIPDGGSVKVLGLDPVAQHRQVTESVGYLSQRFSLYGDLSIDENIAFFAEIHGLSKYDDAARGCSS